MRGGPHHAALSKDDGVVLNWRVPWGPVRAVEGAIEEQVWWELGYEIVRSRDTSGGQWR